MPLQIVLSISACGTARTCVGIAKAHAAYLRKIVTCYPLLRFGLERRNVLTAKSPIAHEVVALLVEDWEPVLLPGNQRTTSLGAQLTLSHRVVI